MTIDGKSLKRFRVSFTVTTQKRTVGEHITVDASDPDDACYFVREHTPIEHLDTLRIREVREVVEGSSEDYKPYNKPIDCGMGFDPTGYFTDDEDFCD